MDLAGVHLATKQEQKRPCMLEDLVENVNTKTDNHVYIWHGPIL